MENSNGDPRLARLIEIKKELELRNALYGEFDRIVVELAREGFSHAIVGDIVVNLKDNFSGETNTGWTSAAVKRYDIELISRELAEKRERKKAK